MSVRKDVIAVEYDKQGYERCDALFANPASSDRGPWRNTFENDALSSMDAAVLGL